MYSIRIGFTFTSFRMIDLPSIITNFVTSITADTWVAELKPSHYAWMFPTLVTGGKGVENLDILAANGDFPSLLGIAPALVYTILLSIVRLILHYTLFQVRFLFSFIVNIYFFFDLYIIYFTYIFTYN